MTPQEKAVAKTMRRHQRIGGFRDMLLHCACGWKSPELKARKGSNDFAGARKDQTKSFERHVAKQIIEAAGAAPAPDEIPGSLFTLKVELNGLAPVEVTVAGTADVVTACRALSVTGRTEYLAQIVDSWEDKEGWEDDA